MEFKVKNIERKHMTDGGVDYGYAYLTQLHKHGRGWTGNLPVVFDNDVAYLLSEIIGDTPGATDRNKEYEGYCPYYIVADNHNTRLGNLPTTISGIYSPKHHKFLDVTNEKVIELCKSMFYFSGAKTLPLASLLQGVNKEDLDLIKEEEKNALYKYISSGNKKISDEEIIDHILTRIPKLKEYANLKNSLSAKEYIAIAKEIGNFEIYLRPIPQDLDFLQNDEELPEEQRKIYLPESEKQERILTRKMIINMERYRGIR